MARVTCVQARKAGGECEFNNSILLLTTKREIFVECPVVRAKRQLARLARRHGDRLARDSQGLQHPGPAREVIKYVTVGNAAKMAKK
jgi:hypothetical protein